MTLDELTGSLFSASVVDIDRHGVVGGHATTASGAGIGLVGITQGKPVGVDAAIGMAELVLAHIVSGGGPLVVLVDTQSQAMSRRDESLGLNEYLAHLAKCLALAAIAGHRTIGILYGAAAAGAFIATALSTEVLVAVPGAVPSVMDLPSMARVTKLPIERLEAMATTTPIFAPGVGPLSTIGAVNDVWDDPASFARRLDEVLTRAPTPDLRDRLGLVRGGRRRAALVAQAVMDASRE